MPGSKAMGSCTIGHSNINCLVPILVQGLQTKLNPAARLSLEVDRAPATSRGVAGRLLPTCSHEA